MATILISWEIGQGSGHVLPKLSLIKALCEKHHVYFAVRAHNSASYLLEYNCKILQAPIDSIAIEDYSRAKALKVIEKPIYDYLDILEINGYSNELRLTGLIASWKNLFELIQPDILLNDYSPVAKLTAKQCSIPVLQLGNSYYQPNQTSPPPHFANVPAPNKVQKVQQEKELLKCINKALYKNSLPEYLEFKQTYQADLCLFPQFDFMECYPERSNNENYKFIGPYPELIKSASSTSTHSTDYDILIYTKPFNTLEYLLTHIANKGYKTLIYPDRLDEKLIKRFNRGNIHFTDSPIEFHQYRDSNVVLINNANNGTIHTGILCAMPMLLLPLQSEQAKNAQNTSKLGSSLAAPKLHPQGMINKLNQLLTDPCFKMNAIKIANNLAIQYQQDPIEITLKAIDEMTLNI